MNLERMGRLYDYVYSTPMDSPERESGDTDQAGNTLWEFESKYPVIEKV